MTTTQSRLAWLPIFGIALALWHSAAAEAQQGRQAPAPAAPTQNQDQAAVSERLQPYDAPGGQLPPTRPQAVYPQKRRSVVQHYQYPYPGAYHGDATGGFRNPGGVGRYKEYYPPGDRFQSGGEDPVKVAKFDQGGGAPDRQEQIEAYNAGTARYNAIQQHIDRYGSRMYFGYGFGMGGFGGFW